MWLLIIVLLSIITFTTILIQKPGIYKSYFPDSNYNGTADTSLFARKKKERQMQQLRGLFGDPLKMKADSIVNFAMQYIGKPYLSAGRDSCGFDCSGFVYFVFKRFGIDVPHQSNLLDTVGRYIPFSEVRKGDILIFTGINSNIRDPGHVGIVITDNGGPVQFIHSSSYDGVKISQVDSTRYQVRYMAARRVLK
jgi:cell wall-associated NlpC family hydrolase